MSAPADALRRTAFAAMGTEVAVLLDAGGPPDAEARVRALFERHETALSRFRPESQLSRLNRAAGRPVRVGPVLLSALDRAVAAARATHGRFDPALGAQIAAAGYDRPFAELPRHGPAARARPLPGGAWRRIAIDRTRGEVTLPPGTAVDLGGIAKGMAVDAAIAELCAAGAEAALVSAGGDMAVLGRPPGREAWTVEVRTPDGGRRVALRRGALATSGVERRRWRQGDRTRHHLLDPATGEPAAADLWSVSVAAATCERAEVAATTAFVLGRPGAVAFLRDRGLAGLLVPLDGEPVAVPPWPADLPR